MKTEENKSSLESIQQILSLPGDLEKKLKEICRELRRRHSRYDWVGIYLLEDDMLALKTYDGPSETVHTRIRIGDGICGLAAETGRTEIIGNVMKDQRYIACFPSTRSEIVVPIKEGDMVLGEIDIDSDQPDAFSVADKKFLESVASTLSAMLPGKGVAEGND